MRPDAPGCQAGRRPAGAGYHRLDPGASEQPGRYKGLTVTKDTSLQNRPTTQQLEAELQRVKYQRRYGSSMTPTLRDGEIIVSVKDAHPEQGDIVAFYYNNKILVKRVIAGPGDWVNIDPDGTVYVNDQPLDEPYLTEKALGECNIELPYQVPDGRFFVLGDHRATSVDSRHTSVGCVAEEQLVGRILFRVWPLPVFGTVG